MTLLPSSQHVFSSLLQQLPLNPKTLLQGIRLLLHHIFPDKRTSQKDLQEHISFQQVNHYYLSQGQEVISGQEIFRIQLYGLPSQNYIFQNQTKMQQNKTIKLQANVPLKQTISYLSSFPRFSLVQKIEPKFFPTSAQASKNVANIICQEILKKQKEKPNEPFVLGLATGSTPLKVYKELIQMYKDGKISFKNVVTFNLDQYYPIKKDNRESYNFYMRQNLFNHIDIPTQNINIPDGQIPQNQVTDFCQKYQKKIQHYKGIDLQILGIGRTGHIGFNEPPSPIKSITRLVYLHRLTRKDAANSFNGIENVPKCAITMGIQTISKAKKIIIMAWSQTKAKIVKESIEGPQKNQIPSTFLHDHKNAVFYLDKGAGEELTRFNYPWTIKGDKEDPIVPKSKYWLLKMIFWLCDKVKKPILRLTFQDYQDNGLSPLVMETANGYVEDLNLYAYKLVHNKITGWPLGDRPKQFNPQRAILHKTSLNKLRILIFSPHTDDDVISMGATMKKLFDQGHHIMTAYMTTGSNSVHDHDALKYLHFMKDYFKFNVDVFSPQQDKKLNNQRMEILRTIKQAQSNLKQKKQNSQVMDCDTIRRIKGLIRSSQAKVAVQLIGIQPTDVYCLQLPFYTHHSKKVDVSEADKQVIRDILKITQPDVIYAAGDITDPHGTHRKCLELLLQVQSQQEQKKKADPTYAPLFPNADRIFFYRGAWQQWDLAMCKIIVPLSPSDVELKTSAILRHQSQKDAPMFPGQDKRQFWQRSKQRNRKTAEVLKNYGFSDYQAVQCFVNLKDLLNFEDF